MAIEWEEAGQSLRSEGYTIDIAPKGCMAVVPQGFYVGQKLRLVNLTNQISCEAMLIWRGHEGHGVWELGLELKEPSADFWGLDFWHVRVVVGTTVPNGIREFSTGESGFPPLFPCQSIL